MNLKTELLPHQAAAVEKLRGLRIGALYMEMGTGKTRTALELIKLRLEAGKIKQAIWLCPCSVKENLRMDIIKHADIDCGDIIICGIESISGSMRIASGLLETAASAPTMLIVDESNLVKNPHALRSQRIARIAERCRYRMILNGTPVSRTEADMFQQWFILDWRVLGYKSYYSFAANHIEYDDKFTGKIRRVLNVDYLTDKIAPYSFQIRKDECLQLPDKIYRTRCYHLTEDQMWHYMDVKDAFLCEEMLDERNEALIYRTMTALQQVASGRKITSAAKDSIKHEAFFDSPEKNPRMKTFMDVIDEVGEEKAVIWCRYQHEIDDVIGALCRSGHSCVEFTGRLNLKKREDAIRIFSAGTQFLVGNKACAGYGLNLQFCHNAVYYTNDFDWATRAQSEDRIHRIGQTEPVTIYDIAAYGTIDSQVLSCLSRKEDMVACFKAHLNEKNLSEWLTGKESDLIDFDRTERGPKEKRDPAVRSGA